MYWCFILQDHISLFIKYLAKVNMIINSYIIIVFILFLYYYILFNKLIAEKKTNEEKSEVGLFGMKYSIMISSSSGITACVRKMLLSKKI